MTASMIVGRGEAKLMATKQKASRAITKKELAYLLRLCTVDATTMQVRRVVNGQVVPPFRSCYLLARAPSWIPGPRVRV